MSSAVIYQATKSAMQSGERGGEQWYLDFIDIAKTIDPFMGWTGSQDSKHQVKMTFDTKAQAENFAKKEKIEYEVLEGHKKKFVPKKYADNFR